MTSLSEGDLAKAAQALGDIGQAIKDIKGAVSDIELVAQALTLRQTAYMQPKRLDEIPGGAEY